MSPIEDSVDEAPSPPPSSPPARRERSTKKKAKTGARERKNRLRRGIVCYLGRELVQIVFLGAFVAIIVFGIRGGSAAWLHAMGGILAALSVLRALVCHGLGIVGSTLLLPAATKSQCRGIVLSSMACDALAAVCNLAMAPIYFDVFRGGPVNPFRRWILYLEPAQLILAIIGWWLTVRALMWIMESEGNRDAAREAESLVMPGFALLVPPLPFLLLFHYTPLRDISIITAMGIFIPAMILWWIFAAWFAFQSFRVFWSLRNSVE